ncbi:hypothetical protein J2Z40_001526 [Cytobacillus eiseniae]|uniref:Uncharacterized protein n=1 Tax=Cytobacillus eiseniae TaxID=762947 RepID=A0ABS4RDI7_9BACI|nr:hypothetical protein [Cytobacillus eiseniae]MBP2240966.1 hypothetical protein [Cytobacillus eiseniae]
MSILWILLVTAFVILLEKPNISKRWNKKEKIIFFVSLLLGIGLAIAWVLQVDLINPMEVITEWYRPISEPFISYMNQFK